MSPRLGNSTIRITDQKAKHKLAEMEWNAMETGWKPTVPPLPPGWLPIAQLTIAFGLSCLPICFCLSACPDRLLMCNGYPERGPGRGMGLTFQVYPARTHIPHPHTLHTIPSAFLTNASVDGPSVRLHICNSNATCICFLQHSCMAGRNTRKTQKQSRPKQEEK